LWAVTGCVEPKKDHIQGRLKRGVNTKDILNRGMLTAIEVVCGRFREEWCLFPM
jgi:hypothetical protein